MKKVRLFFVVSTPVLASLFVVPKVVDAAPWWSNLINWCITCISGWICLSDKCEKNDDTGAYTNGGCLSIRKDYCYWDCIPCGITSEGSGPLDVEHYCGR